MIVETSLCMKCLTSHSAILKSRRLFGFPAHHSSTCRLLYGSLDVRNGGSRQVHSKNCLMAPCMGTKVVTKGVERSLSAKCAKRSLEIFQSCQRPCYGGSLGRGLSTQVASGSGIASIESREAPQRSTFAPRIRIRQIKVCFDISFPAK